MILIESNPKIQINVENGVYRFDNKSGTGKSYICKILSAITTRKDFLCLDASNYDLVHSLKDVHKNRSLKVIILDRYDLYINEFKEQIEDLRDEVIILIDCKHPNKLAFETGYCGIDFTEDKLEVFDYDNL